MISNGKRRTAALLCLVFLLAGCGGGGFLGGIFSRDGQERAAAAGAEFDTQQSSNLRGTGTIWDLFVNADDPNVTLRVNRYIWNASLDVLNFLPVESVDPFSGVIVMGFGTPPGGGRAYRATIYVQDPALDARSLNVALESRGGGAVSLATVRAVEDAILTRARQLRIADGGL